MTDSEIRQQVWELFDRGVTGIDSRIISHLFSLAGAMAGEAITIQQVRKEFIEIDNLLDKVRDLVKPDLLKQYDAPVTEFFQQEEGQ